MRKKEGREGRMLRQGEEGIGDECVRGVKTCAIPILYDIGTNILVMK